MNMQELQAAALAEYESDHRMHLAGLTVDDAIKTFEANLPDHDWQIDRNKNCNTPYNASVLTINPTPWAVSDSPAKSLIICMLMCMITEKEQD